MGRLHTPAQPPAGAASITWKSHEPTMPFLRTHGGESTAQGHPEALGEGPNTAVNPRGIWGLHQSRATEPQDKYYPYGSKNSSPPSNCTPNRAKSSFLKVIITVIATRLTWCLILKSILEDKSHSSPYFTYRETEARGNTSQRVRARGRGARIPAPNHGVCLPVSTWRGNYEAELHKAVNIQPHWTYNTGRVQGSF